MSSGERAGRQPVIVVEYDPLWRQVFQSRARRIRDGLKEVALRIDHIGSTSVPVWPPSL